MNKLFQIIIKKTSIVGIVLGVGLVGVSSVYADSHLNKIKQRQDAMKAVGGGIKVLVGTAKGEIDFDAGKVKTAAMTIKANLERAGKLFPKGTGADAGMENRAKPEIWSNPEGFAAALKKGIAAADNMSKVTDKGGLMAALGPLGGACKGCHEDFRAPKK